MNRDLIIEFRNITKTFYDGKIVANNNISLEIERGKIHSFVGENGSGKSTLTCLLAGLYKQDEGKILFENEEVNFFETGVSKKYKIGMVHQHFHLAKNLSVLENIIVGQEKRFSKFGFINRKKAVKRFEEICVKYKISLKPNIKVANLSVGKKQMVEIVKILWEEKNVLIFDEPTATLSIDEIKNLLEIIKNLKKEGKTILFVSHKLDEVKAISDYIFILRKGSLIKSFENKENIDSDYIAKIMVGEVVKLDFELPKSKDKILLNVSNLSYYENKNFKNVDNISFKIKEGEIFGLAGIQGNGQEEVIDLIAGLKTPRQGEIKFYCDSEEIIVNELSIKERLKYFSHIPTDRQENGIIMNGDFVLNSILTINSFEQFNKKLIDFKKLKFINFLEKEKKENLAEFLITTMNVEGVISLYDQISSLSGGNQQKFVISREIYREHKLLLASHPTRGLDIKAIRNIYTKMIEVLNANPENSIVLYSLELSELVSFCHRIAIFFRGKIIDIIDPKTRSIEEISKLMMGKN